VTYEDPGPYLDGGTLDDAHGVLAIDAPPELVVSLDAAPDASLPARSVVTVGTYGLHLRRGDSTRLRIVRVLPGRVAHLDLRGEP
jgi:hypothetical protein